MGGRANGWVDGREWLDQWTDRSSDRRAGRERPEQRQATRGPSAYRRKVMRDDLERMGSSLARVLEATWTVPWTGEQSSAQHILERFAKRSFAMAESRASWRGRGVQSEGLPMPRRWAHQSQERRGLKARGNQGGTGGRSPADGHKRRADQRCGPTKGAGQPQARADQRRGATTDGGRPKARVDQRREGRRTSSISSETS